MKAKKSLGQNFLKSETILKKIVAAGGVEKKDTILEIGPGHGALTGQLLAKAEYVVAVEKDRELFELLREKFAGELKAGSLMLVYEDILKLETDEVFKGSRYKIVANIPYNITGAILKKFLTARRQPESMTLMLQKEVGERIIARNKKESLLSISVKGYGEPKIVMRVGKEYFNPRPKVDSVVLNIGNISRKFFEGNGVSEEEFWKMLRAGFAHKRKVLSGNLKQIKPGLANLPRIWQQKERKTWI